MLIVTILILMFLVFDITCCLICVYFYTVVLLVFTIYNKSILWLVATKLDINCFTELLFFRSKIILLVTGGF